MEGSVGGIQISVAIIVDTIRRFLKRSFAFVISGWKGEGERYLCPLNCESLASTEEAQGMERLRIGSEWDHGSVFPTTIGTSCTLSSLTNKWSKPALNNAQLTGFSLTYLF